MMTSAQHGSTRLWTTVETTGDEGWTRVRIGPSALWLQRTPMEWRVAVVTGADGGDDPGEILPSADPPPEEATIHRFGFASSPQRLRLDPRLPDRAVVISPADPFLLPPQEEAQLYVSLPVWVAIGQEGRQTTLFEVPVQRPSDTWFGPSTRVGELCYAIRTRARTRLEEVSNHRHRVVSVVRIVNRARTLLPVERLRLPAPQMSLYADPDGQLWTEGVTLIRSEDDELARVELGGGPPDASRAGTLLAGPRLSSDRGLLERTFGGLIRELRG